MSTHLPTLARLLGTWTPNAGLIATLYLTSLLYAWGVLRVRMLGVGGARRWPLARTLSFNAGLFVLALALLSGIDGYADELLSIHVVQHLLLILGAPTLLLWGAPVRLALSASTPAVRHVIGHLLHQRWVAILSRPAFGLGLFALVMLTTHLSGVYEDALRNQTVHAFEHAAYFWSGIVLLAPLLACDPLPRPPSAIARFSWLMGAMVVMSIPAGVFVFEDHVLYRYYLAPARLLGTSALADQGAAGMMMLVGGGVAMGGLAMVLAMQAMLAEERRQQKRDVYLYGKAGGLGGR